MKESTNRIIVVLGMHRSGTSAITYSLQLLGVGLGDDLHPAGFDNPKGFWEDRECLEINEKLLNHLGSAHDRLDFAWECARNDSFIGELLSKAKQLVIQRLTENDGLWGFKDPRTCRLLSFWRDVFDSVGCEVSYVIASRNPLSVASSLDKRNNIPFEKSCYLWLQHMLPAVLDSQESPRLVVDYDLLIDAPLKQLLRISAKLRLPILDENGDAVREYLNDFLDDSLRHTKFSATDVALDNRVPPDLISAYHLLLSASHDESSLDSPEICTRLKEMYVRLKAHTPAFSYINDIEDERITIYNRISERNGQIIKLNQALSERNGQITKLNQALSERYSKITKLNQSLSEHDNQIAKLNQALSERNDQITRLNLTLSERDDLISTRDHEVEFLKAEVDKIIHSNSWLITKPFRFLRRLISRPYNFSCKNLSDCSQWCWHHLPFSAQNKLKFKNSLFGKFPFIFGWTQAYRDWRKFNLLIAGDSFDINLQVPGLISEASRSDTEYVPLLEAKSLERKTVQLICFYLPQYHPIPENNAWWGEGFTEWTNVKSSEAQFLGHYQPHIPGELGYYNLLDIKVQRRQVELAKLYGIGGFCFYFYWFGGKRLLEAPVKNYLNDSSLDLPFCLCWANENWSRRWDGLDREILIAQEHSPEDDLAFIRHIACYMRDPRYIRIGGKPLLLVYRPSLLPSAKETSQRWRNWCRKNGIGDIYLAYTQSFEAVDPSRYGFDAAIEFPPNNSAPPDITDSVTKLSKGFSCTVYDWRELVKRSESYKQPNYKLFRGVCPAWDNTPRRKNHGTIFLNNSPWLYQRWLENAIHDTEHRYAKLDERLVFINAWNEWAEGAYLEPDNRYGYAWLQATRNALGRGRHDVSENRNRIVLVSHDAHPHGAQMILLNIAKTMKQEFNIHVDLVCLGDGPLKVNFSKWATVYDLSGKDARGPEALALAKKLYEFGNRFALVNTAVSGYFLETLSQSGFFCIALIHELQSVLEQLKLHGQAKAISTYAKKIVFPATEVADGFCKFECIEDSKVVIRPQGLYKRRSSATDRFEAKKALRQKLGLPDNSKIVLGVGYADHRKGIDLFIEAGLIAVKDMSNAWWIWVGHWENTMHNAMEHKLAKFPAVKDRFIFPGLQTDTDLYYDGADVFALTSREDPFPSVVLEALDAKVPVVGFDGVGGFADLLNEGCGKLVAKKDANAFANAVIDLLNNPCEIKAMGRCGQKLIKERFSFRHYVFDLLDIIGKAPERISVVIPNYNYAKYLPERLLSVVNQNYPIYEIIFLDDASTDKSISIAEKFLSSQQIDYSIVVNKENSGSVFMQWCKGVELAKGEIIWIAEADDIAEHEFLDSLVEGFKKDEVVIAYTQSKQIDEYGRVLCPYYIDYVKDISPHKWTRSYYNEGKNEIIEGFSIKNTIPNVSAVVFKREPLLYVLSGLIDTIRTYRVTGDWFVYINVLKRGGLYFESRSLNRHRRHNNSVTLQKFGLDELNEIAKIQYYVSDNFDLPLEYQRKARMYLHTLIKKFSLQNRYSKQEIQNTIFRKNLIENGF